MPPGVDKSAGADSIDGKACIYDAALAEFVWQYDALRDFPTLNGVACEGGVPFDLTRDGMLFIGCGDGGFRRPWVGIEAGDELRAALHFCSN